MNLQEEIKALKEQISELEKHVKEEQEFPQDGDAYYYIEPYGRVDWYKWNKANFDLEVQAIGNMFRTKEQAEFAVEKLKVEAELWKFSKPFECGRFNHCIFLDTDSDCLDVDSMSYCQSQGTIYFESEEKAQLAIESVGVDRIKKYIFGVE